MAYRTLVNIREGFKFCFAQGKLASCHVRMWAVPDKSAIWGLGLRKWPESWFWKVKVKMLREEQEKQAKGQTLTVLIIRKEREVNVQDL